MKSTGLIDLAPLLRGPRWLKAVAVPLLLRPVERLLKFDKLNAVYEGIQVRQKFAPERNFFELALEELGVQVEVLSGSLESIPESGPVFVVSNHPFGAVDGLILGSLLKTRRADSKLLANELLGKMPEFQEHLFPVSPFGTQAALKKNLAGMRATGKWLARGHCVATFPAGFVSLYQAAKKAPGDRAWHSNVARLARRSGATVVPIWFEGNNSDFFQSLGRVHPKLRMLMLVREVFNRDRARVGVRIGSPIEPHQFKGFPTDEALVRYFQMRSEILRHRQAPQAVAPQKAGEPIAERQPVQNLIQDIEALPEECLLYTQGTFQVYTATGPQIPHLLEEIGRAREVTFRNVGEGVGKALDLDRFDQIYHHLFLWNNETCELVGAYRIGLINDIIAKHGFDGLYTNKVIDYSRDAFEALGPGGVLELGRSFIVPAYQKRGPSLFLLWRGIIKFVRRHPGYSKLFGTVSISDCYSPMSQALLIAYMQKHGTDHHLSEKVRARKKSRFENLHGLEAFNYPGSLPSSDQLGSLISEIEPDRKGFPVLLKHYLGLNGVILGVGVDDNFGEVLDGFILVDLEKIDPPLLRKYEGRAKAPQTRKALEA